MCLDHQAIPLSFIELLADPLPNTAKLQGSGGRDWTVSTLGEDEEISQSLHPLEEDDTESDAAAVFEGNVDIKALTNLHLPTTLKKRIYELLIPANVVKENDLKFGNSVRYIDEEGTLVGLKGKWADEE
ncbi:PREDICTED: B3 domain-containing protein REM20-like [Camelina sativa]|uniref:B3 domain-containing protein REM20-like n=1 Tax=Camelina sativa TaxID=90675 RepID=A0ABM0SL27_CAMSA|nr:PREDICTED: B3 domain-containing protein REM20-like [Camelina sativa]